MPETPDRPETELDARLRAAAHAYAKAIGSETAHSVLREGLVKTAICDIVIALEDEFPDCADVIEDTLRTQADLIRDEQSGNAS